MKNEQEESIKYAERARKSDPLNNKAKCVICKNLYKLERYNEAYEIAEEVLKENSNDIECKEL